MPQPPAHHPVLGPIARHAQVKLVPQSGSTAFMFLIAQAAMNIGMNARITNSGACSADGDDDPTQRAGEAVGRRR